MTVCRASRKTEEEEWEVERILNKQWVRGKNKYLVYWKGFTAESDT